MATRQTFLDSTVSVDDLVDVLDLLKRCGFPKANWYELGLRLGLLKSSLDVIEKNHPRDVSRCMTECLSQWLGRVDNVDSRGGANLDSLSDALRSMNETAVADKLKHHVLLNIFNNCHTVLSQSLCDSVGIAWLLYAERMLTQEAVSRVVSASPSIPNQREALLTAVKEAVQMDSNSLHTFANVLCTISTNVSLGQTILDDISKYFPTPEVDVVSHNIHVVPQVNVSTDDTKIPANTQSCGTDTEVNSDSSSQPFSSDFSQVEVPFPKHLFVEFSSLRTSYTRMFYNVCKILKRKLDVNHIKEFLSYYSTALKRKVECCSDLSSILYLVKDECSLTNIELLHSVVEEMNITEAEEHIKTYRAELNEFYKSISISLCLKEKLNSVTHMKCESVTLIFDWKPEEHVLEEIREILSKVSGKLLIIKYIETSTSISVTCSFSFSDVGFTVLRMIENIHILMGQGLKKLTIGNLTLWRRQDVRQEELKEKDQDLLQCHTEVIILEEAEYKLRDAISSKEKETIKLTKEISAIKVCEKNLVSAQSDTESIKEVEEEPFYEELTVLSSQFNEIQEENKEMSTKLSTMKIDYLRSLSSNTGSAANKVRRGMAFEIDDCKFHLEAMARPDYQPLVDNKRIIEKLQERITLTNMELITEREHNEKIIKAIKDHLKEVENKKHRKNKQKTEEMCKFSLYCNHPVTSELITSSLKVHKDELLPTVLDKAYELMELAPHVPIERCRLAKYDIRDEVMNQSFDLDEFGHLTIGQIMGVARYYSFGLFLETRKVDETFKKYNDGGIILKISVVDLSTGEVGPAKSMRGEKGWTVGELKQHIEELFDIDSSCMRLVMKENEYGIGTIFRDISDVGITFEKTLYRGGMFSPSRQFYVSSDPKDYQKEYKNSLMYGYVDFPFYSILLNITLPPPQPEATHTTTNVTEEGMIMKIISMDEESKGKERRMKVQVDKRITLAQLKEELVPLIGVPPTGFRLYRIRHANQEYELKSFERLRNLMDQSKLIVRLGRPLEKGEFRIKLFLLQVNNADFCKFMMESIVAEGTSVREFKKQIIEEAKVQEIDCDLELDKMRLRDKWRASPSKVYLDLESISTSMEMYIEPLKGLEKIRNHRQMQVYVIRWHPSQCSVDPMEEIILDKDDQGLFIKKLSEFSGVPVEHISCAQINSFPVELSCLHIENKLKWYSITSRYSIGLYHYGCVVYYKDNRETMKELTDKERSKIREAEEARLKRIRECKSQY